MSRTVATAAITTIGNSLDRVSLKPVKASLPSQSLSAGVNGHPSGLLAIVKDALIDACGSLKAAAITMAMDPPQLTRELQIGTFRLDRLEKLSASEKAVVVERLHDEFASLLNPKGQILRALDDIELRAKLVRQYVEAMSA